MMAIDFKAFQQGPPQSPSRIPNDHDDLSHR